MSVKVMLSAPKPCPICTAELKAHLAIDGGEDLPKPGDVTVCGLCAGLLEMTESGWTVLEAETFVDLPVDVRSLLKRGQAAVMERRLAAARRAENLPEVGGFKVELFALKLDGADNDD